LTWPPPGTDAQFAGKHLFADGLNRAPPWKASSQWIHAERRPPLVVAADGVAVRDNRQLGKLSQTQFWNHHKEAICGTFGKTFARNLVHSKNSYVPEKQPGSSDSRKCAVGGYSAKVAFKKNMEN